MKIEFSKREHELLMQVLEIADWILNAHKNKEDVEHKPYNKEEVCYEYSAKALA